MTAEKWMVVGSIHDYGVTFQEASEEELKQAARHYLEHHVQTQFGAAVAAP